MNSNEAWGLDDEEVIQILSAVGFKRIRKIRFGLARLNAVFIGYK